MKKESKSESPLERLLRIREEKLKNAKRFFKASDILLIASVGLMVAGIFVMVFEPITGSSILATATKIVPGWKLGVLGAGFYGLSRLARFAAKIEKEDAIGRTP